MQVNCWLTAKEAVEQIKRVRVSKDNLDGLALDTALRMARAALSKEIPHAPGRRSDFSLACSNCGRPLDESQKQIFQFCPYCGAAIDWEAEEET